MVRPSLTDSAFLCRCGPFVIDGSHVEQSFSQPWRCTLAVFFDVVVTRCCAALVDCFQSAGSPRAPKSSPFLVLKLAEKVAKSLVKGNHRIEWHRYPGDGILLSRRSRPACRSLHRIVQNSILQTALLSSVAEVTESAKVQVRSGLWTNSTLVLGIERSSRQGSVNATCALCNPRQSKKVPNDWPRVL